MTTSRTPTLVSLAAVTTMVLALGGCAPATSQLGTAAAPTIETRRRTIPFENNAKDFVQVYLVSDQRQWYLGRVEEGARVGLRLPDESLARGAGLMRLVVVVGAQLTPQAERDRRAAIALSQPASDIVRQQWAIAHGMLIGEWLR